MTTNKYESGDPDPQPPQIEYESFTTEDGQVVIYDTTNDRAWIRSTDTVAVADIA